MDRPDQALEFTVLGREYPQDEDAVLNQTTITHTTVSNTFDLQVQQRYLRWKLEVNEQNGFFIMGQPLLAYRPGDSSR